VARFKRTGISLLYQPGPHILMLPIGLQLRKKMRQSNIAPEATVSLLSLDEQIAQLQQSKDSSDSSSSSEESDGEGDSYVDSAGEDEATSEGCELVRDRDGNIVKIVSSLAEQERIKPLPASLLPAARCNTSNASEPGEKGSARKRKIQFADEPTPEQIAISGMEKTVREMLAHYEPVSQDRRPFYCRVCSHQADSLEALEAHKQTEFHAVAVRLERNRSYCKHCEKQFTSPDQLRGHVEGKAHRDKVARMAARKRGNYGANAAAIQYS
jgi:hypothetical protein